MDNTYGKDQEILANFEKENGWIANPLKLMGKRPGTVEKFMAYNRHILEKGTLSRREKALISLTATVALKADHCIHTKIGEAKTAGVSEDEIIQTMLIAGLINNNTLLHTAYEALNEFDSGKERGELNTCSYNCNHPDKLKGQPGECSPEQIKECHGDERDHPCDCEQRSN